MHGLKSSAQQNQAAMSVTVILKHFFSFPYRATIEEVEGDVCELESKLDKVSPTHGKHCLHVHLSFCVNFKLWWMLHVGKYGIHWGVSLG